MTDDEIKQKAKELLKQNTFSGYSKHYKTRFHYMKPGPEAYFESG